LQVLVVSVETIVGRGFECPFLATVPLTMAGLLGNDNDINDTSYGVHRNPNALFGEDEGASRLR
jgi:hypothetical protein